MTRLWLPERPLVLASGSPTRRHLLEAAGLDVEVVVPNVDERGIEADSGPLAPADLARRLALAKARAVAEKARDRIVLAADQVLACEGEVFHKSASLDAAKHQLSRLSNRTHSLHSAAALIVPGREPDLLHDEARLTMRDLSASAIDTYLAIAGHERVTGTVGGYQLEGLGLHLFADIEGAHATILGLPLTGLLDRLRSHGCLAF
ncbi:nucleoside triphosphate pyrophosphatase [Methylobacterium sp. Leaf93]|uniref:Maf family protein n=1 Tax=Methylobacterium sp. Leaf93 TaxID=1736249 RepID=UPI0006FB3179|nr:nucleoside triphosphate pyrophosphatase [Methylobacterium sp. Leaf93]KQP16825.1 septum formation inhibitor Maf [Methylobacterium sp. Leaf93]